MPETAQIALTVEFMFLYVAYKVTVYRTGHSRVSRNRISGS